MGIQAEGRFSVHGDAINQKCHREVVRLLAPCVGLVLGTEAVRGLSPKQKRMVTHTNQGPDRSILEKLQPSEPSVFLTGGRELG